MQITSLHINHIVRAAFLGERLNEFAVKQRGSQNKNKMIQNKIAKVLPANYCLGFTTK